MSEPRDEQTPLPAPPATEEPTAPPRPRRASAVAVLWLAALLVIVIAGVGAAPFWAPAIMVLLPWSKSSAQAQDKELTARVERLEGLAPRIERLQARIDKLEGSAARLDRAENAGKDAQQRAAAAEAAVQQFDQRLSVIETKPATAPAEIGDLRQQLDRLNATVGALGGRLDVMQKTVAAQAGADPTDAGLLLMLLQIRDAIDAGRPFTAEYDAFAALANDRPKIAAAAAPLADAAQNGVASREVLRDQLAALAGNITNAEPPPAASNWRGEAWARMRSLITIRRIGGAGQSGPEIAVSTAQRDLAQGDLATAIAKLQALTGASAEAAKPWLLMANTRLTVEQSLRRTEQLLTAQLGAAHKPGQP